ncbi:hypothetical protein DOE57_07190 [Salmonella enterica subsp. salamae serovar 56:b:[1,5]]|uniref:Uncharacterized protein n=1 Tax=Salmonella enterica subsp. salamae serovar 56:b:[1,5] TaxID=2577858 RepID=A0A6C7CVD2_SALER|nr:hypothetical protein DOE57_07190 [Salmonella enterica subsp. salamae serovar 56:b:[1,5]]
MPTQMLHDWYRIVFLAAGTVEKVGHYTQHCRVVQRIAASSDKKNPREYEDCYFCGAESRPAILRHLLTLFISKQAHRRALVFLAP